MSLDLQETLLYSKVTIPTIHMQTCLNRGYLVENNTNSKESVAVSQRYLHCLLATETMKKT